MDTQNGNIFDQGTQNSSNNVFTPQQGSNASTGNIFDQGVPLVPQDVTNAKQYVGQHVDQGECEAFAEQITNGQNWGQTANDAFKNQVQQGLGIQTNDVSQAPIGSKIYFAPDNDPTSSGYNGGNGHVGILIDTNGDFISADYSGVHQNNLSTWSQTPIGYVPITQ